MSEAGAEVLHRVFGPARRQAQLVSPEAACIRDRRSTSTAAGGSAA